MIDNILAAGPPVPLPLLAPKFLGIVVNFFLWGIQTTQTYYYYKSYRKSDKLGFKITVVLLFLFDGFQTICASKVAWVFLVGEWGNLKALTTIPNWGTFMLPFADGLTASVAHCFYAHKVYELLSSPFNYIVTLMILVGSLTQLAGAIGCTAFEFAIHLTVPQFGRTNTWIAVWLISASVTDIVITVAICWKLNEIRTGYKKTDDIISKLIRLTVEAGIATAVVQIVDCGLFLRWPSKPYHSFPTYIAAKVYSISVLAFLNSRVSFSETGSSWDTSQRRLDVSVEADTYQTVSISRNYELYDGSPKFNRSPSAYRSPTYRNFPVSPLPVKEEI